MDAKRNPHLVIEAAGLTKVYAMGGSNVHALNGVDLQVRDGEFVAFMGASGSGKSTLLHLLGCLDRPSAGEYRLEGEEVSRLTADQRAHVRNVRMGFIFVREQRGSRHAADAGDRAERAGGQDDRAAASVLHQILRSRGVDRAPAPGASSKCTTGPRSEVRSHSAAIAESYTNLGDVLASRGYFNQAAAAYEEGVRHYRQAAFLAGISTGLRRLAELAWLRVQDPRAVLWFAAAEAGQQRLNVRRIPAEQQRYERHLKKIQAQLDEDTFSQLWVTGTAMSLDEALDESCADSVGTT
jgi:ABC-type oligopeptide transport system ATPase subunit